MIELKPCPFCGGEAEIECETHGFKVYTVSCRLCDLHAAGMSEEVAVMAWNRRCAEDAKTAPSCANLLRYCGECKRGWGRWYE